MAEYPAPPSGSKTTNQCARHEASSNRYIIPTDKDRGGTAIAQAVAYGTGELPAMVATSRDYHAYRSASHLPGDLIPIAKANHFTILDELRLPDSHLTREVLQLATYRVA